MRNVPPVVTGPTLDFIEFNRASTRVVFAGVQLEAGRVDAQYIAFDGGVAGPARRIHPATARFDELKVGTWAPASSWFSYFVRHYAVTGEVTQTAYAVNLSGAMPAAPFEVPMSGMTDAVWLPASTKLLAMNGSRAEVFDPTSPDTPPLTLESSDAGANAVWLVGVHPRKDIIVYRTSQTLHLADLSGASTTSVVVQIALRETDSVQAGWLGDSSDLLLTVDGTEDSGRRITAVWRVDGAGRAVPFCRVRVLVTYSCSPERVAEFRGTRPHALLPANPGVHCRVTDLRYGAGRGAPGQGAP